MAEKQRASSGSPYEVEIGFCRALRQGSRILVSGTAPLAAGGASFGAGDPRAQARRCLEIIVEAVRSLGGRQQDIVRTRIFLTRREDWEAIAEVHGEFFADIQPTSTCVVVSQLLRPEWCVEMEAEALIGDEIRIDPCDSADRQWIEERSQEIFSGTTVVNWGVVHRPAILSGFVARLGGDRVGLATYTIEVDKCELVTIDALVQHRGVGSLLLRAVEEAAREAGCHTLWVITTNDNLDALRFYQRRGYVLVDLHPKALELSRSLKPAIPQIGHYGIPVRDELVLEKSVDRS